MKIIGAILSCVTFSAGVPIGFILGGLACGVKLGMRLSIQSMGLADMFEFSRNPRR